MKLNITDKDKASILIALYNNAIHAQAVNSLCTGELFAKLSIEDAQEILNASRHVDVINGIPINIVFNDNEIDVTLYEKVNGLGELGKPRAEFVLKEEGLLSTVPPVTQATADYSAFNKLFTEIVEVTLQFIDGKKIKPNSASERVVVCENVQIATEVAKEIKSVGLDCCIAKPLSFETGSSRKVIVYAPHTKADLLKTIELVNSRAEDPSSLTPK